MTHPESFLPEFCSLPTALILLISSWLLAFVLTLADFSPEYGFWVDLGLRAFFIAWIVLPSGTLLCALRRWLVRLDPLPAGLLAFAVVQGVTLAVALAASGDLLGYGPPPGRDVAGFVPRVLAVSGLVAAFWLRFLYLQFQWRRQSRAEVAARLEALQARMRPHFLFNSLNAIADLIRREPPHAEALLLDLADVLRAILKKEAGLVPLAEEVELTRRYLHLEQARLGDRLAVVWDLEPGAEAVPVPLLSLQPLVENAVRHGIEPLPEGGRIAISGCARDGRLILTVRNPLPAGGSPPVRPGNREAMPNLRARLEAGFEARASLEAGPVAGEYRARIVVPWGAPP